VVDVEDNPPRGVCRVVEKPPELDLLVLASPSVDALVEDPHAMALRR
jgi:hypothetical protein